MKRLVHLLALVTLLVAALVAPVGAQDSEPPLEPLTPAPSAENGLMVDESSHLWFVELSNPPTTEGGNPAAILREQDTFRANARRAGLQYTERFAFQTLWNGLSISVAPAELGKLTRISGIKALYPVVTVSLPEPSAVSEPDLATALAMTGADVAQSDLGYTGAGIRVAVMDTGVDYDHADLGGDGVQRSDSAVFPTARVVAGWDFVGDAFDANPNNATYNPNPVPDARPDDCNGHGTHVAGIIGASGAVTGVAPGVTFGAYRVFGCVGSTTADIMIAAMERALADDMDVLNMSIGSAFQWPQYPTAVASDRLVNQGMVVVASIGNSGANGLYSAGAPGLGSKVIGVASFDNSHINALTFNVNPSGQQVAYLPLSITPDPPTSGTTPEIVYLGRGCVSTLGDTHLADPAGKVALIVRGDCTFNEKYQGAADAGAVGVLIYNSAGGLFAGGGVVDRGIFGVGISNADGLHIRSQASPTLTWTDVRINAVNPSGGLISSFSSYGLSPDLSLKPDIGAPGGLIRSTYPLEAGAYAILSGTSMSSPHVAGAAALLLEARPNTSSQVMRDILQNSADPKNWWGNPGLGFLDNVHRQGAGMVDIDDAILSTTKIEPGKLSLGESEAGPATRTLTLENNSGEAVTYDLSHIPALSTRGSTFSPIFTTGFAGVSFSASSVTVPAGGTATVDVTITANSALAQGGQYGGYIVFTPQGGGQTYRVPYAGFKGDYQSITVLTPSASAFGNPLLRSSLSFGPSEPVTFNPAAGEVAWLLVHLDHQVRRLRVEVFDAATGKAWHRAYDFEYVGRNSTNTGFFALPWDGVTVNGNRVYSVPDGEYVLQLSVLKALGDASNPAHWESWTSPVVTIDRP